MGTIVSLTGVTGAGKTTVARNLGYLLGEKATMVESITTRSKRPSDLPDEYQYLFSVEEFTAM